jgi:SAM-dependent methyltransferase
MPLASELEIQSAYRDVSVAERYVQKRFSDELNRLLHDRQVAAVQRAIDQLNAARVLEIAPGPGRITRHIQPRGSLVCLEYNEGMIERGRQACDAAIQWVRGNAFDLPFAAGFDLVYSFRFLRHFHRADRDRLYAQIRRVLRPGGGFLFDAVNARVSRPLREAQPENYPIYDKLYDLGELRQELTQAGFEPIRIKPVQKWYGCQYCSQVFLGPRANWMNRLIIRTLELLPRRQGLEWIVLCRRA